MALKENYRELLLDAVVRVAARDGLDRTTTKLIAAEVPCNEVYIYRNFGSKDGLLQAAFNRTDMRFVQTVLKNLDVMDKPGQPAGAALPRAVGACVALLPGPAGRHPVLSALLLLRAVPCQRPRTAPPQLSAASGPTQPVFRLLA